MNAEYRNLAVWKNTMELVVSKGIFVKQPQRMRVTYRLLEDPMLK